MDPNRSVNLAPAGPSQGRTRRRARTPWIACLLACAALAALAPRHAPAKDTDLPKFEGTWRLVTEAKPAIDCTLTGTIGPSGVPAPVQWVLYIPKAPMHPWQRVRTTTFTWNRPEGTVDGWVMAKEEDVEESGAGERMLQRIELRGDSLPEQIGYTWKVRVEPRAVRLEKGQPAQRPLPLSAALRKRYLADDQNLGLTSEGLTTWVRTRGLKRGSRERDLAYAYRVLDSISKHFVYKYPPASPGRAPADVIRDGHSDCGGFCTLFVAACRRAKIPARILAGRWVIPTSSDPDQFHVKAEFYAKDVGWVPIDGSGAVQWAGKTKRAFGRMDGQFLVMHEGLDLMLDSRGGGPAEPLRYLQRPAWWVRGRGRIHNPQQASKWAIKPAEAVPAGR